MNNLIRNLLGVVIIIGVVAFSYAAWSYSQNLRPSSFRNFSVSGEGTAVGVPDIAKFTFTIITEGGLDVNALQADNSRKATRAIDFIKSNGIPSEDIKTQSFNIDPRYSNIRCFEGPCPAPEIVGYSIRQSVSVTVRDFSKAGSLIAGVVNNGANSVSQLFFEIEDVEKLKTQAREMAFIKAKEKAEAIARAGGFKVGRLITVHEDQPFIGFRSSSAEFGMGGGIVDVPIEAGSEEIRVNIVLQYEIK